MTKEALITAIRTFEFFPTVAALVDFFSNYHSTTSRCPGGEAVAAPFTTSAADAWWQINPRWNGDKL